ncbi:MAG TPA: tautomerase family protein [Myxococcales bacterium]|nr:tautomerase family protein [Myxococcales bacterium]
MPLVRIALRKGTTPSFRRAIGESIHRAMVETIGIPEADRFQIFSEHDADSLVIDRAYLGIARTDAAVLIQISMSSGRTLEARKALFDRIARRLHESPGLRLEDVFVTLVETQKENWSFGNGIAQYAT